MTFSNENSTREIFCVTYVHQPIPILVAKVWQRKLDYAENLQAKYFTGENIPIYGKLWLFMKILWYVFIHSGCGSSCGMLPGDSVFPAHVSVCPPPIPPHQSQGTQETQKEDTGYVVSLCVAAERLVLSLIYSCLQIGRFHL